MIKWHDTCKHIHRLLFAPKNTWRFPLSSYRCACSCPLPSLQKCLSFWQIGLSIKSCWRQKRLPSLTRAELLRSIEELRRYQPRAVPLQQSSPHRTGVISVSCWNTQTFPPADCKPPTTVQVREHFRFLFSIITQMFYFRGFHQNIFRTKWSTRFWIVKPFSIESIGGYVLINPAWRSTWLIKVYSLPFCLIRMPAFEIYQL